MQGQEARKQGVALDLCKKLESGLLQLPRPQTSSCNASARVSSQTLPDDVAAGRSYMYFV